MWSSGSFPDPKLDEESNQQGQLNNTIHTLRTLPEDNKLTEVTMHIKGRLFKNFQEVFSQFNQVLTQPHHMSFFRKLKFHFYHDPTTSNGASYDLHGLFVDTMPDLVSQGKLKVVLDRAEIVPPPISKL